MIVKRDRTSLVVSTAAAVFLGPAGRAATAVNGPRRRYAREKTPRRSSAPTSRA